MSDSRDNPPPTLPLNPGTRWRWGLYVAIIALATGQGWAQIQTATVKYTPDRWQEARPPHTPFFSANDRSRWCTVWSLAERGTWQIDEIITRPGWDTIDKVYVNGHFYSSKPPFVSLLVAHLYRGVQRVTGYTLDSNLHDATHAVLLVFNLLPWVIALLVLARLVEEHAESDFARIFVMLVASLGTFLTPFLITLNNHTPAAVCLVFSLAPLVGLHGGRVAPWRFAVAGFFAAACACCELPAATWGLVAFVVAWRAGAKATCIWFVPAALIPLATFLLSNWQATGSVIPTYASFGAADNNPYHYVIDGIPSYWLNPSAIDRGETSVTTYLWHCTFGHHGIFSLTPVFLLSLATWMTRSSWRGRTWPFLLGSGLGLTVWVLAFYVTRTQSLNYGGVTSGLRWAFWLIPLWVLALVPILDRWQMSRARLTLAAILLGLSTFSITIPRDNPWQLPWLTGIWQKWFPSPTAESPPVKTSPTWVVNPPRLTNSQQPLIVRYHSLGTAGGVRSLTLTFEQHATGAPMTCRVDPVAALIPGDHLAPGARLDLDLTTEPWPHDALPLVGEGRLQTDAGSIAAPDLARRFFTGLPAAVVYRVDPRPRYVKTRLRPEAFECQLLSASVLHQADPQLPQARYRRQVWWCNELPWGALQIEDTVADPVDNSVISRTRWRLATLPGEAPPPRPHDPPILTTPILKFPV
jgi:hypothetical protein